MHFVLFKHCDAILPAAYGVSNITVLLIFFDARRATLSYSSLPSISHSPATSAACIARGTCSAKMPAGATCHQASSSYLLFIEDCEVPNEGM